MSERLTVMISSTILDLPEHRRKAEKACQERKMLPVMMEHRSATNRSGLEESLKMVEEADIYLCIIGWRYGSVPDGCDKAVTHLEYLHAVEKNKVRLVFIMSDEHVPPMPPREPALESFVETLLGARFVKFFKSPDELHAQIANSLADIRVGGQLLADAPKPPRVLDPPSLESRVFVGRKAEIERLNEWVSQPESILYRDHIFVINAIGGEGKSALAWKWFTDLAPQKMSLLAGSFWWSFYDDPDVKNFIVSAYSYVSGLSVEQVQAMPAHQREDDLLNVLSRKAYLFVLDGVERLLVSYAGTDIHYSTESEGDNQLDVPGILQGEVYSSASHRGRRKTIDPAAGAFLRRLASLLRDEQSARILITTRVYPLDLENRMGWTRNGCSVHLLSGLSDNDAVALWHASFASGSRQELLELFNSFGNHALLIEVLAGEVTHYMPAPGDFHRWRQANPGFDPLKLPLKQRKLRVLEFAMKGLSAPAWQVLRTIAAFHTPAAYDAVAAIMVGDGNLFGKTTLLDDALHELVNRNLLGWDKVNNRFDVHPLVRGFIRRSMSEAERRETFAARLPYFKARRLINVRREVKNLEDLNDALELYYTYVNLEDYEAAARVFATRLSRALLYRLSASRHSVMLLKLLFPDGTQPPPRMKDNPKLESRVYNFLATSYFMSDLPERGAEFYRRQIQIDLERGAKRWESIGWRDLAEVLRLTGALRESEAAARRALSIKLQEEDSFQVAHRLRILGSVLAARGRYQEAWAKLSAARQQFVARNHPQTQGLVCASMAQLKLLSGSFDEARDLADCALGLANNRNQFERDFIRAIRLQGEIALARDDIDAAKQNLELALKRARAVGWVREEIPAAAALAEVARRNKDLDKARELLEEVLEEAEAGHYRLSHADARNVLAQIERDAGEHGKAVEAAERAYGLAWCDGPPFAYHWGLEKARALLKELGATEPMPPFGE